MEFPQYFYWLQVILWLFTIIYLLKNQGRKPQVKQGEVRFIKILVIGFLLILIGNLILSNDYSMGNIYHNFIISLTISWAIAIIYIISKKVLAKYE